MKKDMVAKVNSVASEFRKVSDLQMAETTKRTIRENVAINSQLQRMSRTTTELIRENDQLKLQLRNAKRQMEILEFNEKELNRRNLSSTKVLKLMTEKATEQREDTTVLLDRATRCTLMEGQVSQAAEEVEACHREAAFYKGKLQFVEEELRVTQEKLATTTKELAKMSAALGKASLTIQASLQPIPSEDEHPVQRENLLVTLLDLLKFDTCSPQTSPLAQKLKVPGYRPGDLGLVPAPKNSKEGLPPINNRTSLTGVVKAVQ